MSGEQTLTTGAADRVGSPERIWFLSNLATVLLPAEAGLGFSIVEMRASRGDQPPLHLHRDDDEGFYVREGRVALWVGSEQLVLEAGDFALAPKAVPHTYRVESEEVAWLAISSDASFDRFVRAYGEPAREPRLPDPVEPDVKRLARLAEAYGIEILGPPGALPG